jgi:hypothetical protein
MPPCRNPAQNLPSLLDRACCWRCRAPLIAGQCSNLGCFAERRPELEQPRPAPSPFDDCRARPDSDPRDVCPVCRAWLLLRAEGGPEAGLEACADPLCKAAHGVRVRQGLEVRSADGSLWRPA